MNKLLFGFLIVTLSHPVFCQNKGLDYENRAFMRFYYGINTMHNPNYEIADLKKIPFKTFGFSADLFRNDADRWRIESKMCDDFIYLIGYVIKNDVTDVPITYYSVTGLLWFHKGIKGFKAGKLPLTLGFSLSDYTVIAPKVDSLGNVYTNDRFEDPSGWFWAAGPTLFLDKKLNKSLSLHVNTTYDLSFLRLSNRYKDILIPKYNKPHFFNFSLLLMHRRGPFAEYEYTRVLDMGGNKNAISRGEFHIGLRTRIGGK